MGAAPSRKLTFKTLTIAELGASEAVSTVQEICDESEELSLRWGKPFLYRQRIG